MTKTPSFFLLRRAVTVLAMTLAGMTSAMAVEVTPQARLEVDQLLSRLGASGCEFNRNGAWHSAVEARDHLAKKYQYLLEKKLMASAEDFIALGASKSSMSGQAYSVRCQGQPAQPSAEWLSAQLRSVRAVKADPAK